ncbi:MAG: ATP synthase F1 subunit delta, partial [Planctomycetales bacterium]
VGVIYGKAFFGAAESAGSIDTLVEELASLVEDVLDRNPAFEEFLANPMVGSEDKSGVLDRVFAADASPVMLNFLKVLAENDRLGYLRPILQQVHQLNNERNHQIRVEVRTAHPLDDALQSELADRIRSQSGYEPELVASVDPDMIGGIVLRIGDTVYDGSVSAELHRMHRRLLAKNIEEIETNRTRFQLDNSA